LSRTQQILQNSAYVMAARCVKGEGNAVTVTRSTHSGRKITASRKLLFDQVCPLYSYHLCSHICFMTVSVVDYITGQHDDLQDVTKMSDMYFYFGCKPVYCFDSKWATFSEHPA